MVHGEIRMVKCRTRPRRRGVARGTVRRRKCGSGCGVIWIRCGVVVFGVATVAIGRQRRVVIIYVAARARYRGGMKTGQWENSRVVIKRRSGPCRRVMAEFARLRESDLYVVGTCSALIVCQVAGHAGCYRNAVVVVDMAACAGNRRGVKTSQRETCARVIKHASCPR
jgi:hypothetical protein